MNQAAAIRIRPACRSPAYLPRSSERLWKLTSKKTLPSGRSGRFGRTNEKQRLSSGLQRAKATLERFRLPLLILTLGGILLLLPSGGTGKAAQDAQSPAQQTQPEDDMRQALSRLLSSMEGVGRVELLLTTTGSDETFYQTDVRRSGETSEETTVFSANQSAQKTPVVTKTKKASYAGAVVVCDGADSAVVRLRIVQAVSALTGLGSDKISVIKMKQS